MPNEAIAGGDTERRHGVLQLIRTGEIQGETKIRKTCPGFAATVVAPLAIHQRLEFTGHGVMRPTKMHQVPATLAAVWPNSCKTACKTFQIPGVNSVQ
jgi:hypothetical protein